MKKFLPPFIIISLLLAAYVTRLRFFVDDFPYALDTPSITVDFFHFFSTYVSIHGLFRPLALVYYWFIYSLYFLSDSMAHLVPFAIHAASGYVLYRILKRHGMSGAFALLAGFLYLLHPFATEQYMWLSANPGTIVNAIFLIQILLIEKMNNQRLIIYAVAALSLVSGLVYESTLFLFIPLIYLIWTKTRIVSLIQIIPIIIYVLTKALVKGTDPRPLVDSLPLILQKSADLANNMTKVYLDPYYVDQFWNAYRGIGLEMILATPLLLGGAAVFFLTTAVVLFSWRNDQSGLPRRALLFWGLVLLSTLPPLVANKEFYFGFRSLFLPSITGVIFGLWVAQAILGKNSRIALGILGFWTIVSFFTIDITIADKYRRLYDEDMRLAQVIAQRIDEQNLTRVSLVLKSEVPFDSRASFLHADHLLSCFFYEWSSLSCLRMVMDKARSLTIEHVDGRITTVGLREQPELFLHVDKNRVLTYE